MFQVLITVANSLINDRMGKEIAMIKEDEHKAVIYESILLLTEVSWAKSEKDRYGLTEKVERFCRALRDTEAFSQPGYIGVPEKYKPQWDNLVSMEVFSSV